MFAPNIHSRMKKSRKLRRSSCQSAKIGAFISITYRTGVSQVFKVVRAFVFQANNMLNLENEKACLLG